VSLVLHSSLALEWIYADEASPALVKAMETVIAHGAWVPAHWRMEIATVLEHNTQHVRHNFSFRDETLRDLSLLPIRVDPETHARAWEETLQLALRLHISLYDAAYLELAKRRGLALAVVDQKVRHAAKHEDLVVVG